MDVRVPNNGTPFDIAQDRQGVPRTVRDDIGCKGCLWWFGRIEILNQVQDIHIQTLIQQIDGFR